MNDVALALTRGRRNAASRDRVPKRVLIAVGGHLGDAVIASSILPQVSGALPGVEIGVLCPSWSRVVFESHPRVRHVHVVDHWKLSRAQVSLFRRWARTRRTERQALAEIRGVGYNAALDLSAHYPNSARLLERAGIPVRIGYTSGGYGSLYTHGIAWSIGGHVADEHRRLLEQLTSVAPRTLPRYELAEISEEARQRARQRLLALGIAPDAYVVMHMGAGTDRKEWPIAKWSRVAQELSQLGVCCALTGAGDEQRRLAERLVTSVSRGIAVNMVDELSWPEFRGVIAEARLVISVDTVAGHLAGAAGVPCVALMTGMDRPDRWRPLGERVTVLSEAVPCAPCYLSRGCAEMSCIRGVTVDSVMDAARHYLAQQLVLTAGVPAPPAHPRFG